MKAYRIGVILTAILMVVAGIGFGIAQAAETHAIGEFMEWQTVDQGSSSSRNVGSSPVSGLEDQEILKVAQSPPDDIQLNNPIETGSLSDQSDMNDFDHSNVPLEGNTTQYWGSDNPSN
jgi:hypothetical protein